MNFEQNFSPLDPNSEEYQSVDSFGQELDPLAPKKPKTIPRTNVPIGGTGIPVPKVDKPFTQIENAIRSSKQADKEYQGLLAKKGGASAIYGEAPGDEIERNKQFSSALNLQSNELLKKYTPEINKPIDDIISSGKWEEYITQYGVFNDEKARRYFDYVVKKNGGDTHVRELMVSKLENVVLSKKNEKDVKPFLKEEIAKTGLNLDKDGNVDFSSIIGTENLKTGQEAKLKSIAPVQFNKLQLIENNSQKEVTELFNASKELFKSEEAKFNSLKAQIQGQLTAGQITQEDAQNTINTALANINQISDSLNNDFQKSVRAIRVKNSAIQSRISKEIGAMASDMTLEDIISGLPKDKQKEVRAQVEDAKLKVNNAYENAYSKLYSSKNEGKKAQESMIGLGGLAGKSFLSGWNNGLASLGGYLNMNGVDNSFTDWLREHSTTGKELAPAQYEWSGKEWYKRGISTAMQSTGMSLPTMAPTLAVTAAGTALGVPAVGLAAVNAVLGYLGERSQNSFEVYNKELSKSGNPNDALRKAETFERLSVSELPFHLLGGLADVKLFQLGASATKSAGKGVKSIVTEYAKGFGGELLEEYPTELLQNYNQEKLDGYKGSLFEYGASKPELFLDTLVSTLGQGSVFAGAGKVFGAFTASAPESRIQFYTDMIQKNGIEYAKTVAKKYYDSGILDGNTASAVVGEINSVSKIYSELLESGLDENAAKLYVAMHYQSKSLSSKVEGKKDSVMGTLARLQLSKTESQMKELANGTLPYVVMELPGGENSSRVISLQDFNTLTEVQRNNAIQASNSISVINDEAANTSLQEQKQQLGNTPNAPVGLFTNNIKTIQNATQESGRTQQTGTEQGGIGQYQGTQPVQEQATNEAENSNRPVSGTQEVVNFSIPEAINKVQTSLESTGVKVQVVENEQEYDKLVEEMGGQRGTDGIFDSNNGTIILNPTRLKQSGEAGRIIWHEGAHPVMNIIRNTNRTLYDSVVNGFKNAAKNNKALSDVKAFSENYEGEDRQLDEAIVEAIGRINDGTIDINAIPTGFKQSIIDFINIISKTLGLGEVLDITDIAQFKKVAGEVANALKTGTDISSIVGIENVQNFQDNIESPEVSIAGSINQNAITQARLITKPIVDVYATKEMAKLPVRTMEDVYNQYGGKATIINSDPTRTGKLVLPSGKEIFMYGGPGYLAIAENANNGIGFATTEIGKVGANQKYVKELFGGGVGVTFVGTQTPGSMLSNSYALRYVLDAISLLPKKILKSTEFKNEFFGKDLLLLKSAFGDEGYKNFIDKYSESDLSSPDVIDGMINEMGYKLANDNRPATFKARRAFVDNLLAGVVEKKSRAGMENESGYISKTPNKFIAKALFDRMGLNAEKLFYEIGEKSLVDAYMNEGKWGFAVSGFEVDPNADVKSIQSMGVQHPLFNAKFPGKNAFILDGGYQIDDLFKPVEMLSGKKNEPYTKKASQMLAGSMYVKGEQTQNNQSFEFTPAPSSANKIQARVASNTELVNGFYSPIENTVNELQQKKGTGEQMLAMIKKGKNVTSDELEFTGIDSWLKGKESVSKEDIVDFIKNNKIQVKDIEKSENKISWTEEVDDNNQPYISAYVPGGVAFIGKDEDGNTTYKLPGQFSERLAISEDDAKEIVNAYVSEKLGSAKFEQYQLAGEKKNYKEVLITIPKNNGEFINPVHFDEPNIVAHIRMNTRKDSEGNDTLFLEEIQSDWAQEGRKKGFRSISEDDKKRITEIEKKLNVLGYFIKNNKVATRSVDSSGQEIFMYRNPNDLVGEARILANDVANIYKGVSDAPYVKKTDAWVKLALKKAIQEAILQNVSTISWTTGNQQGERYPGDPTRTAGMNAFYGNENESGIVGKVAKKLIKELTGKEGVITEITISQDKAPVNEFSQNAVRDVLPGTQLSSTQPSIEITPELKASVKEGMPQFRKSSINWEKSKEGKGDPSISSRNEFVMNAANDLKNGKISNEEYRAVVSENSPIRPITRFFEPATRNEMFNALSIDKRAQINQPIEDGKVVGLRLDIPAYKNNNTWVVSVHDGNTNAGKVLSYDNVARITNVTFGVEPKGALAIATGKPKATIGRMFGEWQNIEGETVEAKGENAKNIIQEVVDNPEWIQVGMNPFRHSYFYDRSSDMGRPVNSAEEVVQVGGLVYAKNPEYGNWTDESYRVKDLFDKNKAPVQFRKGIVPTGGVPSVPGETGVGEAISPSGLPQKKEYNWEKGGGEKPIPGETMIRTSTGRYVAVETMNGQKMDIDRKVSEIEKAKPSFYNKLMENLRTAMIDNQAKVLSALSNIGRQGQLVKAYLLTRNSASSTATMLVEKAIKDIYGKISKKKIFNINGANLTEYQLFNQMIGYQRVISIQEQMNDAYKAMINSVPGSPEFNINRQRLIDNNMIEENGQYLGETLDVEFAMGQVTSTQAKALLYEIRESIGEEAFDKLMVNSEKYSKHFNDMMKDRLDAGLVSKETYDHLSKYFYAPTRYISDILSDPILSISEPSTDYSKDAILRMKKLAGGSENLNVSDYEGLLRAVTYASEYSIAENRATNRFYDLVSENKANFEASGIRIGTKLVPLTAQEKAKFDVIDESVNAIQEGKKPNPFQLPSGQKQLPFKGMQKASEMGVKKFDAPIDIITDENGQMFRVVQEPLKEGEDYIKTYFNGQRYDIIVPRWFATQWYNRNTITNKYVTGSTSWIAKLTGSNLLRIIATGINPVFGVAQLIPDSVSAYAATLEERRLPLLIDYPRFFGKILLASIDIKRNSKDFQEAVQYGATTNFYNGGMVSFEKGLMGKEDKSLESVIEGWKVPGLKQYIIASKKITETTEQMSKVALYKSIRDNKIESFKKENNRKPNSQELEDIKIEAGSISRSTADFHRKGVIGGELNKIVPYLNAGIQVGRAVYSSAKQNPYKVILYAFEFTSYGVGLTLSSLGLGDDDELKEKKRKAYLKLSDFDRDNRVLLYFVESKNKFVSIKIPDFLVPLHSLQRRMVERIYLENKELTSKDAYEIAKNVRDAFPLAQFTDPKKIASRNPAYSMFSKMIYNEDPYRKEEVVPYEESTNDYLEGAQAGKKRASKISQMIGEAAISPLLPEGISPKRLDAVASSIPFQSNPFSGAILFGLEASTSEKDLFEERYGKDALDKIMALSGVTNRYFKEGSKINQSITGLSEEEAKGKGEFKNTVAEKTLNKLQELREKNPNARVESLWGIVQKWYKETEYNKLNLEEKAIARSYISGELKAQTLNLNKTDDFVSQIVKIQGSDPKIDAMIKHMEEIALTEESKKLFINQLLKKGLLNSDDLKKRLSIRSLSTLKSGKKNEEYDPKVQELSTYIKRQIGR